VSRHAVKIRGCYPTCDKSSYTADNISLNENNLPPEKTSISVAYSRRVQQPCHRIEDSTASPRMTFMMKSRVD
jgi:hypothetical protein